MIRKVGLAVVGVLSLNACVVSSGQEPRISVGARTYLESGIKLLEENFVRRDQVDFSVVRAKALEAAKGAQTTADTYPALRLAVSLLNERHSAFLTPEQVKPGPRRSLGILAHRTAQGFAVALVFPGSAAAQNDIRVGDLIKAVNGKVPTNASDITDAAREEKVVLDLQRGGQGLSVELRPVPHSLELVPTAKRLEGNVGYLELPRNSFDGEIPGQDLTYHQLAQQMIAEVDQRATCGWVVDLRRNTGGDQYPMMAAVGPIIGEGRMGSFSYGGGKKEEYSYNRGRAEVEGDVIVRVESPYTLKAPLPSVAVLTSNLTNSAGESILVGFKGRPNSRVFGERSQGNVSANQVFPLSDGAALVISVAYLTDRTGTVYRDALEPDSTIPTNWSEFATPQDPVLVAARTWLQSQSQCQQSGQ